MTTKNKSKTVPNISCHKFFETPE